MTMELCGKTDKENDSPYETEDRNPKPPVNDPIDQLRGGFNFFCLETYEHSSSTKYPQRDAVGFATGREINGKILLHKMQSSIMCGRLLLQLPIEKKVLVIH